MTDDEAVIDISEAIDAEEIIEDLEEVLDDDDDSGGTVIHGSSRSGQSHHRAGGAPRGSGSSGGPISYAPHSNSTDDEDDDGETTALGTEGGYGLSGGSKEHVNCLHCGAAYTYDGAYHGYYCERCRPPNGFR